MRILFVAMSHSIHTARWIGQLADQPWDIHLFPSRGFDVHPALRHVTVHGRSLLLFRKIDPSVRMRGVRWPFPRNMLYGRLETLSARWMHEPQRLAELIDHIEPDIVHSLEIQSAGYLTLSAKRLMGDVFPPWIVTNWGSDTYYYQHQPEHREKIREVFESCDYYDCECKRDVADARRLGFSGTVLPVTPNAGGMSLAKLARLRSPDAPSARRLIMVKGYQHWVGRALTALQAIEMSADALRDFDVCVYGASRVVAREVKNAIRRTGLDIKIIGTTSHDEILRLHGRARMSIGVSMSDGVSTSFLEALAMGSFPIQSNTCCADEWIEDGKTGILIPPEDPAAIAAAIRRAAQDDELVDRAWAANWKSVEARLDESLIKQCVLDSYRRIVENAASPGKSRPSE